jgi:hypothetical protein
MVIATAYGRNLRTRCKTESPLRRPSDCKYVSSPRQNWCSGYGENKKGCCDAGHIGLWRRTQPAPLAEFKIAMKLLEQAMNWKAQTRISWHRLAALILGLLMMAAPISASVCGPDDCFGSSSKTEAGCGGMNMSRNATVLMAGSRLDCCQVSPGLPATVRPSTVTERAKAEFLPVALPTGLANAVAARRTTARPLDSSPPQDLQSLFCTLLI